MYFTILFGFHILSVMFTNSFMFSKTISYIMFSEYSVVSKTFFILFFNYDDALKMLT